MHYHKLKQFIQIRLVVKNLSKFSKNSAILSACLSNKNLNTLACVAFESETVNNLAIKSKLPSA